MLRTLLDVMRSGYRQFVAAPRRTREYDRIDQPFEHRTPEGHLFLLDPHETVDRHIFAEGIYERRFLEFVDELLPRDAVVLDVGANIGNHAIFLRRRCSQIHCFEPNPRTLERLRRNLSLNGAENVIVHPVGLGGRDAEVAFYDNVAGNLGASRFAERPLQAGEFRETRVPMRQGDAELATLNLPRLDLIKIDVEGMEEEVLSGLAAAIGKFRPLVAFEYHGSAREPEVFNRIHSHLPGYAIVEMTYAKPGSSIVRRALWHLAHGGRPVLRQVHVPERRSYENLLAVPSESRLAAQIVAQD